ncbi:MAG: cell division topological specificity factor MinE [Desulfobacterales bacterium]|nr:cell division topological specificity factor MinE [Desulfobacterales bacterium]MBF0398356.1 cell division topological specificity factor MinE [Desulfobacterales bacterium]
MFNFFKKLSKNGQSKDTAKKRLQITLLYDKLEVSKDILDDLNRDIVEVISRYFEIDKNALTLDFRKANDERMSALVVNTPILGSKQKSRLA